MYTGSVLNFPLHAIDMLVCLSTKTTASNMPWQLVSASWSMDKAIHSRMNCTAFECMHPLTQEYWRNFHKDTWGDLHTSSGAVLIAKCWRQALGSLPQECYRFHRAAANNSKHDVAGRIPEWVMPTDRAQRVWREEHGNRIESAAQHSLCEATIMHSTAHVLHREMCKFEAGLVMLENLPIKGSYESEEMERRE